MWEEANTARLRSAHKSRDDLIDRWRLLTGGGGRRMAADDTRGAGMRGFPRRTKAEVERLNRLQAAYFGRNVEIFEPPLPEGVPERLERIVDSAGIEPADSVLDVGTGTGILLPLIRKHEPGRIYANDLSEGMLEFVRTHHRYAMTAPGDVADLAMADQSIGVAIINACYPNIIDKGSTFTNLRRMLRPGGRLVISHPLGRSFVEVLKKNVPLPLDDFPATRPEAAALFMPYGFQVSLFIDEKELYILRLTAHA